MHAHAHLALHHVRAAELRTEADTYRLARASRGPRTLRTALGQTLIDIGHRLTAAPSPAPGRATVALSRS